MPIATPEIYSEMIDRAKTGGFAFPGLASVESPMCGRAAGDQCRDPGAGLAGPDVHREGRRPKPEQRGVQGPERCQY